MNKEIHSVLSLLESVPRVKLGFFPTPLHKLEKLSEKLGVNLYIKRDDLTGISQFGGNKIRKLEFLLAKAIKDGCDTVFTYGATQSNHAMQTATACRKLGLNPILYLVSIVEPDENDIKANLLLDRILNAEVVIEPLNGADEAAAEKRAFEKSLEHAKKLESQGHKCCMIPVGGANGVGSAGFIGGFVEMLCQMDEIGISPDYIFHASGSGGTIAGLVAGKKLTGSDARIVGIGVSEKDGTYLNRIVALANSAIEYIGSNETVTTEDFHYDSNYYAPGYEMPSEGGTKAIKELAATEGIFVDPVYSGKGFAGMLDYIRSGKVPRGSNVLFWHTGGNTALFAEKKIIGSLSRGRQTVRK